MSSSRKKNHSKTQRPFSIYKTKAMEDYFKFMSKQGRHIVGLSEGITNEFAFEEGAPSNKEYKLILSKQRTLSESFRQELKDLGWNFVCTEKPKFRNQRFHLFETNMKDVDSDIIDKKNRSEASNFQHRSLLSILTSRRTIMGLVAFVFLMLALGADHATGRRVAFSILAITLIGDAISHYFEVRYEKEYIEEVMSKSFAKAEWEEEKQRYRRNEIIITILSVVAMIIPVTMLRS